MSIPCGRLAPSPTGHLHLGNAWSFLWAWLACRREGGKVILRLEDLDPDRSRQEFAESIMDDLRWLGLDWDEGPFRQHERLPLYKHALAKLDAAGRVYPCYCTRREVREKELRQMASAPHPHVEECGGRLVFADVGASYPGTCRNLSAAERIEREAAGRRACLRLRCPEGTIAFTDLIAGPCHASPEDWGGDFALQRSDGVMAYQLAVVVDDGRMGVTQVVRGADILPSTPRQLLLFDLLRYARPTFAHVPLLCDAEGFRLAKRHGSLSLRALRDKGISAEAITGYLAWKAGLIERPAATPPRALLAHPFPPPSFTEAAPSGKRLLLEPDPAAIMAGI